MLLYLRMVLPSSRTPPPQFSASSTNRRTTHLAGRRRQPLTPQTWASPAEPLAPRHVRLPLTPPRAPPASADEDTRSLTPDIIPHDAPHTKLEPTNPHPAACTATRRRDNRGLAFPAAEAVKVDHVRRSQHTGHPGLFSCRLSLRCSTAAAAGAGSTLLASATSWVSSPCSCCLRDWTARCTVPT